MKFIIEVKTWRGSMTFEYNAENKGKASNKVRSKLLRSGWSEVEAPNNHSQFEIVDVVEIK